MEHTNPHRDADSRGDSKPAPVADALAPPSWRQATKVEDCPLCGRSLANGKFTAERIASAFPEHQPDPAVSFRYCPADKIIVLMRDGKAVAVEDSHSPQGSSAWRISREGYYNAAIVIGLTLLTGAVVLGIALILGSPTEQIERRLSDKYGVSLKAPNGWANGVGTWKVDGEARECRLDKRNLALKCEGQAGAYQELTK